MSEIRLYNTLTKSKEDFVSIKPGHVTMYHCGPTVYNFVHIGNLRAFIVDDLIRRLFEFNGYTVTQIMNITDIGHLQSDADDGEDKMTLAIKREGKELTLTSMQEIARRYYDAFRFDLEKVNVLPAHLYPFASEHVSEDILFVQKLLDDGHAYKTADGVYFDIHSIPKYGRLGGVPDNQTQTESRIGDETVMSSGKKDFRDFAVWKFNSDLGYDADFGKGFPGWHIECSVMSMKYLGEVFDIHSGGIDHISVHHNNEIAQCEAITGKLVAHFWLHNGHVIIEGGNKMAKSGENFITLNTLSEKGVSALGYRYWLLGTSYRMPIQFSFEAVQQAEQGYKNLTLKIARLMLETNYVADSTIDLDTKSEINSDNLKKNLALFTEALNDDMNTAKALASLHESLVSDLTSTEKIEFIRLADHALGLALIAESLRIKDLLSSPETIPVEIKKLADERALARTNKNWTEADLLRAKIEEAGYEVKDTTDSYTLFKRLL